MNNLHRHDAFTAEILLTGGQAVSLLTIGVLGVLDTLLWGLTHLAQTTAALLVTFYAVFALLKTTIWCAGARAIEPSYPRLTEDDPTLPRYTVLVPLYQETAVFDRLVRALQDLRYPVDKLEVLLLLEADDTDMVQTVRQATLPGHFAPVVVPTLGPRTKPKACNYAMSFATGEHVVIFDAEDRPEPDHLLKAVSALRTERARDPRVVCVQAVLRFWNPRAGITSRYYWAEYIIHFEWTLPGLRRLGLIPPLGGTSNHFHNPALRRVAEAYGDTTFTDGTSRISVLNIWDSHNVTEDADLAARLARLDYRIGVFSALTLEEAPHRFSIALKQRTRWLQGYLITGLVHTRQPLRSVSRMGPMRYLCFALFMIGTPISLALNPFMWAATLTYPLARLGGWTTTVAWYETLFPPILLYTGATVMVLGNFLFFVQTLLTSLAPRNDEEVGLAKWLLLTPLWWAFTSLSAYRALWRLLTARSNWEKTPHGHDQHREESVIGQNQQAPVLDEGELWRSTTG